MTIHQVTRWELICDSCAGPFEQDEETIVFEDLAQATFYATQDSDWTLNGEGLHHCGACMPLELTEAAVAEAARKITASDLPLIEVFS